MPYGGGVAIRKPRSETSVPKYVQLTSFRVLITAGGCTKHLWRVTILSLGCVENRGLRSPTPEKHCCALVPVFSTQRVVSADPPRECQTRGRGSPEALDDAAPSRCAREGGQANGAAPGLASSNSRTVRAVYKVRSILQALPVSGQLG